MNYIIVQSDWIDVKKLDKLARIKVEEFKGSCFGGYTWEVGAYW